MGSSAARRPLVGEAWHHCHNEGVLHCFLSFLEVAQVCFFSSLFEVQLLGCELRESSSFGVEKTRPKKVVVEIDLQFESLGFLGAQLGFNLPQKEGEN